jgi:hypothetical protein
MKLKAMLLFPALVAACAPAATLRPSAIVYGEVRDAYGIRLNDETQVSAFLGTNEVARTTVGVYPEGANYRMALDVYDPLTAAAGQVKPGDIVSIRVKMGASFQPTIGNMFFIAPGDGACVRVDLIIGQDTDHDGLPDAWEQMVIANSGGAATNLAGVGPGKDLDRDGMTDDQEFWYGSFAFLAGDELKVDSLRLLNGRYTFRFLTVLGSTYRVEASPALVSAAWATCSISLSDTGDVAPVEFQGNGDFMTVYIVPAGRTSYYRLRAS